MNTFRGFRRAILMASFCFLMALCVGCSLKVQRKALHEVDDLSTLAGLDGQSPWLKAHLPDGGLYVLDNWTVDDEQRVLAGRGQLLDPRRKVIEAGLFQVSLDSIAILESNVIQTSPAAASLTVLTVASLSLTAYCIANPKACFGSCPTFYALDDSGIPVLMAEGFSASVSPGLEDSDLDALFGATASGDEFRLAMTNEALETHVIRRTDLLVTPRPPTGRVMAAQDGSFWQVESPTPATSCRGLEGDCTQLLASFDGVERFSEADSLYLGAKEYLELEFGQLPPGDLGLIISSRHTLLSTFLFYQGLAYLGEFAAPALARLDDPSRAKPGSEELGDLLGKIEVQVPGPGGSWQTVGVTGETGPLAVNTHLLRLPDLDPANPRLRLKMTRGNWRLDYVALAALGARVTPARISPSQVLRDGVDDPDALADLTSDDRALISLPGDRFDLVYRLPAGDGVRDVFLESRGYYLEWMRTEWLAEEDPLKAAFMFRQPQLALSYLAPVFKELEPEMETQFWGSRYAR